MGRIRFDDATKPRIRFDDLQTRRRLTDADMAEAMGAEPAGALPSGGNVLSAYALRNELLARLRSSGGRPSLTGADIRTKVPLRKADLDRLELIAASVETDGFRPTASQIASVLLDLAIKSYDSTEIDIGRRVRELAEVDS